MLFFNYRMENLGLLPLVSDDAMRCSSRDSSRHSSESTAREQVTSTWTPISIGVYGFALIAPLWNQCTSVTARCSAASASFAETWSETFSSAVPCVNQLSQALIPSKTTVAYGYDAAHNLTRNAGTTQAYNPNESLQTVGAATVGSDQDGNQKTDVSGNTLSWNSLSQLEQFSTT